MGLSAKTPKGIHDVHYQITKIPPNKTVDWVKSRMDLLAPKLRSQIAVKLQLGYTPELRFQLQTFAGLRHQHSRRLAKVAGSLRRAKAEGQLENWTREMSWGKPF